MIATILVFLIQCLAREQACTSSCLDLLLGELGEVLGLDDHGVLDLSVSKKLEVSKFDKVNHGSLARFSTLGCLVHALSSNIEQLVDVQRRGEGSVLQNVEMTHTNLTEVTRVIFVH